MENTIDVKIGQVVRSKSGRDKGEVFTVLEIVDEKYVRVVNGKSRKLDNPKCKSVKHLYLYRAVLNEIESRESGKYQFDDAYVRRLLKPYIEDVERQEV